MTSFFESTPPCEVSMPFTLRPYHRFPVQCAVKYHTELENQGLQPSRSCSYHFFVIVLISFLS